MRKFVMGLLLSFLFAVQALAAVDINKAGRAELESVKGIGPKKALAIVEYREKNGPFKSVDDLGKVKGFGKATLAKLRKELAVGDSAGKNDK